MENKTLKQKLSLSNYQIQKTIGRGTFGKVKKAIHKLTLQPVAIKILEKQKVKDVTDVERVSRQLHILKMVRHSTIAQLYQIIETSTHIYIVMEYSENGQFFDFVMDGKVKNQQQAFYYFSQILDGLLYLHRNRIAHRDIKPENILLDTHNKLKVVDFGLSNMYSDKQLLNTACGSPCYASPQMIKGQSYDPQLTDVWSLGIVLYAMIFAKLPFQDDNTSVLYSKIKAGVFIIDKKISIELRSLLTGMLSVKKEKRLNLNSIQQHPWCKGRKPPKTFGITIGYQQIPIDQLVVNQLKILIPSVNVLRVRKQLSNNIKNQMTSIYYQLLKKRFKNGIQSQYDICSDNFNKKLLQVPQRIKRHKSFDVVALTQVKEVYNNTMLKGKTSQTQIKPNIKKKSYSLNKSPYYQPITITKPKSKILTFNQPQQQQRINLSRSQQKQQKIQGKRERLKTQQNRYNLISIYQKDKEKSLFHRTPLKKSTQYRNNSKNKLNNQIQIDSIKIVRTKPLQRRTLKEDEKSKFIHQPLFYGQTFWKKKSVNIRSFSRDNRKIPQNSNK